MLVFELKCVNELNRRTNYVFPKFMYCCHNNLLPPLFFNLSFTNSQIHGYSTRTANNYRVHHCRSNLQKFTILYQGPKIWNSLPVTITSLSSFFNFKEKTARVFSKIITELAKPHTCSTIYVSIFLRTRWP